MKILLIDSGVGGLSIYNYLKDKFPNNEYSYLMDNKNFPYGEKSREQMVDILINEIKPLTSNYDKIIIACNTLSTIIEENRILLNSPTITMMDLHKISSLKLIDKEINILCTSLSTKSNIWKQIYPKCNIIDGENLAQWIENKDSKMISDFTTRLPNNNPIILSCTHYNFIKHWIPNSIDVTYSLDFLIDENDGHSSFTFIPTSPDTFDQDLLETFKN